MKIQNLKTNHLKEPLGYQLEHLFFSWEVKDAQGKQDKYTRIEIALDEAFQQIVHDSGKMQEYGKPNYKAPIQCKPQTRYYWRVEIETDAGEHAVSDATWFETAFEIGHWPAKWIACKEEGKRMPYLYRFFHVSDKVKQARLYACGLGLYECYLGNEKLGDEFLMPGYHSYDLWNQYQTFDVTNQLTTGNNTLLFLLGEGWYKGRFVFEGGFENLYGDRKILTAVLQITYEDGTQENIYTDENFQGMESSICENNIYDGEVVNRDIEEKPVQIEVLDMPTDCLVPRVNVALRKVKQYKVKDIIYTKSGDVILDFGESITGWVEVYGDEHMDFCLQYGEWMQNGEFYRDNLRTAKAEFKFKGYANNEWLRPHFTYYGFRYVKVTGITSVTKVKFVAYRLMSDMEKSGEISTSNEKINKLLDNTLRSQQCNFIDIPMDCPQRDERMGWTGDIAIFARTASYHMHTASFLHHYMKNLNLEQSLLQGSVPFFVPRPKVPQREGLNPFLTTDGACTWGDAATIIPWELYLHYQDEDMLAEHYPGMCAWVDHITERTTENDKPYLWQNDNQLGDWLALDNGNINNPIGSTDMGLIATAYYYHSTNLCKKAAGVLGKTADYKEWEEQEARIKAAFIEEYLKDDGTLTCKETQTAYAIVLQMGLYEKKQKAVIVQALRNLVIENDYHLNTGFVGTAMLMQALAENGCSHEAYSILLQEDYPSWLREVNLGATTMWERWNSVDDKGIVCDTDMNSLNHYAYGSIAGWMYEDMCGFSWNEEGEFVIRPLPNPKIQMVEGKYSTVYGTCSLKWEYTQDSKMKVTVTIPFQANVRIALPWGETHTLKAGTYEFAN